MREAGTAEPGKDTEDLAACSFRAFLQRLLLAARKFVLVFFRELWNFLRFCRFRRRFRWFSLGQRIGRFGGFSFLRHCATYPSFFCQRLLRSVRADHRAPSAIRAEVLRLSANRPLLALPISDACPCCSRGAMKPITSLSATFASITSPPSRSEPSRKMQHSYTRANLGCDSAQLSQLRKAEANGGVL